IAGKQQKSKQKRATRQVAGLFLDLRNGRINRISEATDMEEFSCSHVRLASEEVRPGRTQNTLIAVGRHAALGMAVPPPPDEKTAASAGHRIHSSCVRLLRDSRTVTASCWWRYSIRSRPVRTRRRC